MQQKCAINHDRHGHADVQHALLSYKSAMETCSTQICAVEVRGDAEHALLSCYNAMETRNMQICGVEMQ